MKRSNDANTEATKTLENTVKMMIEVAADLKENISKPREAVFDDNGNPIGTQS